MAEFDELWAKAIFEVLDHRFPASLEAIRVAAYHGRGITQFAALRTLLRIAATGRHRVEILNDVAAHFSRLERPAKTVVLSGSMAIAPYSDAWIQTLLNALEVSRSEGALDDQIELLDAISAGAPDTVRGYVPFLRQVVGAAESTALRDRSWSEGIRASGATVSTELKRVMNGYNAAVVLRTLIPEDAQAARLLTLLQSDADPSIATCFRRGR